MSVSSTTASTTISPAMKLMNGKTPKALPQQDVIPQEVSPADTPMQEAVVVKPATKSAPKNKTIPVSDTVKTPVAIEADDLIVSVVHEVENLAKHGDKALKMVSVLLDATEKDYFRLGGVLSVIKVHGLYMDKGYAVFKDFVTSEMPMVGYRKAMYLINIYDWLAESGIRWAQVKQLGWTKLKELAPIVTTENVEEWVALAEGMTVLQLIDQVKAHIASTKSSDNLSAPVQESQTSTMTFKVHKDQRATIAAAIEKAMGETGTTVSTVALEYIALDFLGGSTKVAAPSLVDQMKGKSIQEVLDALQTVFPDVDLTVTVPEEETEE